MEHFKEVDEEVDLRDAKQKGDAVKASSSASPKKKRKSNNPKGRPRVERDTDGFRLPTMRQAKDGVMEVQKNVELLSGVITDVMTINGKSFWRDPNGGLRSLRKYETADQLREAIEDWELMVFDKIRNGDVFIPDAEALAVGLDISVNTLNNWRKGTEGEEYAEIIGVELNRIAAVKNQLAMHGAIPVVVWATMMNNMHGYSQNSKVDVEISVKRKPMSSERLIAEVEDLP